MFKLEEVGGGIFHLSFDNQYDLAMHFLRLQEFYESPNLFFQRKPFKILDFMDWYSKENDNKFTYTTDWGGFNVPGYVFKSLYQDTVILDENKYDAFMKSIFDLITSTGKGPDDFYLIGTLTDDNETIKHEIAHGMFLLNSAYNDEQCTNLCNLNSSIMEEMKDVLYEMGYDFTTVNDEVQAYLSTGIDNDFKHIKNIKKHAAPFIKTFNKHAPKK